MNSKKEVIRDAALNIGQNYTQYMVNGHKDEKNSKK
jgi:hypothetical protein